MRAALSPSTKVGSVPTESSAPGPGVEVGDEGVEAVRVPLRMAARKDREASRLVRQMVGVPVDHGGGRAAAAPQRLGRLLVEYECLVGRVDLDPQPVLPARRDLTDDDRPERTAAGLEVDDGGVLGLDAARALRRWSRARRLPGRPRGGAPARPSESAR